MALFTTLETQNWATWLSNTNSVATALGDLDDLNTTDNSNLVDAINEILSKNRVITQIYADTTTGLTFLTNLNTTALPANTLANDGDMILARYGGEITGAAGARTITLALDGTGHGGSSHILRAITVAAATYWTVDLFLIRESSSIVRYTIKFMNGTTSQNFTGSATGLDLAQINDVKLKGQCANGADLIALYSGMIELRSAV